MKKLKNNKCPGIDGFSAEFFKFFWPYLKHFILKSLNFAYERGELSISLRSSIVSCILKGNKSCEYLKNWRPISLLSVPYKIASLTIANRLKEVLESIISKSQSGFITGRFIGENTRLIYDVMHYIASEDLSGQLLLIDFEKAFDSVSWPFLTAILNFLDLDQVLCVPTKFYFAYR